MAMLKMSIWCQSDVREYVDNRTQTDGFGNSSDFAKRAIEKLVVLLRVHRPSRVMRNCRRYGCRLQPPVRARLKRRLDGWGRRCGGFDARSTAIAGKPASG